MSEKRFLIPSNKQLLDYFLILLIVFLFVLLKGEKNNEKNTLIIGTAAGYAPFLSINEKGGYEGFDIQVASALAKQLEKKLIAKDLGSMTSLFLALANGSIDAIIWGLSITQERAQKTNMIRYYGDDVTSYSLLFWNQIPENIKTIQDMCGKTICVEPNSSQEAVLNNYPCVLKKPTEKIDDVLLNLQYDKADAALVDFVIAKKNTTLANEVTKAFEILKNKGIINTFAAQWGIE